MAEIFLFVLKRKKSFLLASDIFPKATYYGIYVEITLKRYFAHNLFETNRVKAWQTSFHSYPPSTIIRNVCVCVFWLVLLTELLLIYAANNSKWHSTSIGIGVFFRLIKKIFCWNDFQVFHCKLCWLNCRCFYVILFFTEIIIRK